MSDLDVYSDSPPAENSVQFIKMHAALLCQPDYKLEHTHA